MLEQVLNTTGGAVAMVFQPEVLVALAIGSLIGAAGGALPGITTTLAVGVSLPFTFTLSPEVAVAFLVAITVGVNYGNSIPAVLVGMPGTPAAVLTAVDGYKLHMRGESGTALGVQYFAALTGQLISTVFFVIIVVPLSQLLYVFLSPELWALHLLGMTAIISLTGKNIVKGIVAAAMGLAVTFVGPDPVSLVGRFTFGVTEMRGGLQVVPVVIGVLAVSELIRSTRQVFDWEEAAGGFATKFPGWGVLRKTLRPIGIGTVLGTFMGAIPGVGGTASSFVAYQQAKMWSKTPDEFGEGSIEGLAANEASQNASQAGEMVPTFGFGIPGSGSMVLLLAALTLHGLLPGPLLIREQPSMLYAATAGLLGGVLVLALIGWPIAKFMLRVVSLDRSVVLVMALVLSIVGVFSLRNSVFDVGVMLLFGLIGYAMLRYGYSTAAFALAVILGEGFEGLLRRGLLLTDRSFVEFLSRPITAAIVAVSVALLVYGTVGTVRMTRRERRVRAADAGETPATEATLDAAAEEAATRDRR